MPRIHGDGTEDDFNQGWGGSRYEKPLWGSLISGVKDSYRLHLNARYIFYHDIDMRFEEHGGRYGDAAMKARRRTGTPDSIVETEFVVCYYKKPSAGILQVSDSLDVGNMGSEKAHAYAVQGFSGKVRSPKAMIAMRPRTIMTKQRMTAGLSTDMRNSRCVLIHITGAEAGF